MKVNRIPFSLKDYKTGKYKVVARDNKYKPIIFRTNSCHRVFPIQGAIDYMNSDMERVSKIAQWTTDGHNIDGLSSDIDLMLEKTIFENGDIITIEDEDGIEGIAIFNKWIRDGSDDFAFHALFDGDNEPHKYDGIWTYYPEQSYRPSTGKEVDMMLKMLCKDDMEWSTKEAKVVSKTESSADNTVNMDSLSLTGNLKDKVCFFQEGQTVIVRDDDNERWVQDIFIDFRPDFDSTYPYVTACGVHSQCADYKTYKKLLGHADNL